MWRLAAAVSAVFLVGACGWTPTSGATVEFYIVDGYRFTPTERREIERIVYDTVSEVQAMLPALPDEIVVRVRASSDVIHVADRSRRVGRSGDGLRT